MPLPRSLLSAAASNARARTPTAAARAFSHSAPARRGLAFSLDGAAAVDNSGRGKFLRMIMFGKPGAGKGTLSGRLVRKYEVLSLSTGDLLRQHIAEKTEVGRMAEEIVAGGGFLPDEVMLQVVTSELDALHNKHWILDGFPRTLGQGKMLDEHLARQGTPLSLIANLDVPDEVILSRISDRWVHLPSGRVYNLSYNPPKVAGHDDDTGEPLIKRPDDNPEIFARRLEKFYDATSPLLAYYKSAVTLSGTTSDEIWPKLENVVRSQFPALKERAEHKRRTSLSEAALGRPDAPSAAKTSMRSL